MAVRLLNAETNEVYKKFLELAKEYYRSKKDACREAGVTVHVIRHMPTEGTTKENLSKLQKFIKMWEDTEKQVEEDYKKYPANEPVTEEELREKEQELEIAYSLYAEAKNDFDDCVSRYEAQNVEEEPSTEKGKKERKPRQKNLTIEQEDAILNIYRNNQINKNLAILTGYTEGAISSAKRRAKDREETK